MVERMSRHMIALGKEKIPEKYEEIGE